MQSMTAISPMRRKKKGKSEMDYRVRHTTRHVYDTPISENVMEVRLHPRIDASQQCSHFALATQPRTSPASFVDYLGNTVHTFNVRARHQELLFVAESVVTVLDQPAPPNMAPPNRVDDAWSELDSLVRSPEYWDMLNPTERTANTPLLEGLAQELRIDRSRAPLDAVEALNQQLNSLLVYDPEATHVHSNLDDALATRRGVCQDFTHIMLALLRNYLRMPCRYASGYLYHSGNDTSVDGASHAWLEALIPGHGWIGFDPTNNLRAGERHIRVAYGRDYSDVAPTRGVFSGEAISELSVAVSVKRVETPVGQDEDESWLLAQRPSAQPDDTLPLDEGILSQLQQQQQQ